MLSNCIKAILWVAILLLFTYTTNAQNGCTDPSATNYSASAVTNDGSCIYPVTHNYPVLRAHLPSAISESSGLVWTGGQLWTHNDSGNPNDFFRIDTSTGAILQTVYIDNATNTDWEDITADSNYIYMGNFGNNNGDRTDLQILKVAKANITSAATIHLTAEIINFSYSDQTSFASSSTNNFDCESVISIGDSLYIFTKDRGDLKTRVYRLPKVAGTYSVSPYTTYNVNGLITGADYNPITKEVALVGYMSGHLNSFMWFLNDFQGGMFFSGNKRRIEIGAGDDWATEGVTYINNNRLFISCENSGAYSQSFYVVTKNWASSYTSNIIATSTADSHYSINPNPANDLLHIDCQTTNQNTAYRLTNIIGATVLQGSLDSYTATLPLKGLAQGMYILELTNEAGKEYRKVVKE